MKNMKRCTLQNNPYSGSPMKKCLVILLHNLKDIMVISTCAKFHFENSLNERLYILYVGSFKFVFWSAAIKVAECEKNESRRALMT